jgi:hypothetical protein
LGGADRPDAVPAGQAGGDVVDDGQQPGTVVLQLTARPAQCEGETADGHFLARGQQDAQRLPVTIGAWRRKPIGVRSRPAIQGSTASRRQP